MTTTMSRWIVPAVGLVLGLLISAALLGQHASPAQVAVSFLIVVGYAFALRALQSRSDVASLLSGLPTDERWETINLRALSLAAQLAAGRSRRAPAWLRPVAADPAGVRRARRRGSRLLRRRSSCALCRAGVRSSLRERR